MILFKHIKDIKNHLAVERKKGHTIGFVPTMGALHQGHISLIKNCNTHTDICVCSIFVNPTQFNNTSDFEKYPITIEKDIEILEKNKCDILFMPFSTEIYPLGRENLETYNLGYIETILEGEYRPGHFQGVCQVMQRLLNIIQPEQLFLGQKDYQQCMVLNTLVKLTGSPAKIMIEPTVREKNGLAMSSRNMRLNTEEKKHAAKIFETLSFIKNEIKAGDTTAIKNKGIQYLQSEGFIVDYLEIVTADGLSKLAQWDGNTKAVIVVAAFLNNVRLIDNLFIN